MSRKRSTSRRPPSPTPAPPLDGLQDPVPVELFQPVGSRPDVVALPRPHPSGRSRPARRQQTQKRQSNRADFNPHAAVTAAVTRLKAAGTHGLRAPLDLETQVRMASTLVQQFYIEAQGRPDSGERMTANARKQAAIAYGVVTDKLAMLQGRPTQILQVEEAEAQRPAVWELVRKLAAVREERPS